MTAARFASIALVLGALSAARPASASFHFMQIEQVIAGVDGSTSTQAISCGCVSASQNLVSQATIRAWDATGRIPSSCST
jgi:hypothetical protein